MRALRGVFAVLLICIVAAAVGLGAGCSLVSPEEAMAETVDAMAEIETMAFTMDMVTSVSGEEMPMTFEGSMRMPADVRLVVTMEQMGQQITYEQISLGSMAYIKYPGVEQWGAMEMDITVTGGAQSTSPMSYVSYLESFSEVEELEDEEVDGVLCRHFALQIDGLRLVESLQKQSVDQGVTFDDTEFVDFLTELYQDAVITAEVWVGTEDMLPRKETIDATFGEDMMNARVTGTMTFDSFNEPVDIEAPAESVPLEQLIADLTAEAAAAAGE